MLGSKIKNLMLLKEENINVPEFFIIKYNDVIKKEIKNFDLKNKNTTELKKISKNLKEELENNINIKFNNKLEFDLYSVRSSASIEDGDITSFAGQFDTYLNVSKNDLNEKILDCFKSLYNVNVLEYIKDMNLELKELKMNVIVQKMIPSELSGVVFTCNPQGILNEVVIVVAKGLGENVVQDKGDTTTYYYNTTDKLYYYSGKDDLLTKEQIEELLNEIDKIKAKLGNYLDIEFAFYKNKIYILQARPITTIEDSKPLVLDNSNIVESYPGISLPLTCSFVNTIYSGVFKGLCRRILKNEQELDELNNVFSNMVGNVNGRIYYKISNWYTLIKHLPLSNKIIPIWQEMLGIKNKNPNQEEINLSFTKKIRIYKNSISELLNVPKNMNKLNLEFQKINEEFYEKYNCNRTPKELKKMYDEIKEKLLSCWDITLLNDLYAFIFTGLVKNKLKRKYKNSEDIANKYISGISNIESLKPIKEMINIAYSCEINSSKYIERKNKYIKKYGDRNLEELKLESETFRTNESLFDKKIIEYQKDKNKLKELYDNINKENEVEIKEDFITKKLINKCMLGIKNREISRLNRSRIFGIVREIFLSFGKYYEEHNVILTQKDIFYLTEKEIFNNIEKLESYIERVKERKNKYISFNNLPAYTRLIFTEKEFDKIDSNITFNQKETKKDLLYGTPCSSGIVEAEALVVNDINNIGDVNNKILITKMTDPGWVFLLATAKGVISEKGSLLSHTAIISRELKIPAIVGVSDLLKNVKNGDIIRMDATTGEIKIKKRGK